MKKKAKYIWVYNIFMFNIEEQPGEQLMTQLGLKVMCR